MDLPSFFIIAQASNPSTELSPATGGLYEQYLAPSVEWVDSHLSVGWLQQPIRDYGPNLLGAVLLFVVGRWVARAATAAFVRGARKARVDETVVSFLKNVIYMGLLTVAGITALGKLGVDLNGLTAMLAAAGFAVGMALQGSLGNLAAGVMLVFFKPFRVGDVVEVCGHRGTVVEIEIFNTILLTLDNVRIVVPNGKITEGTIRNYSAERERRIDLLIGCGYNDNLKNVKDALTALVRQHPKVLKSPEPQVAVSELSDSSVNFVVRPWVASSDYWEVRFELLEQIKTMFDDRGFTIPFPSRDVFVHSFKAAVEDSTAVSKAA